MESLDDEQKLVVKAFQNGAASRTIAEANGIRINMGIMKTVAIKENAEFKPEPYPTNDEVWKAFEEFDKKYQNSNATFDSDNIDKTIYGFARRVIDILCDHRFIHGWCGDTNADFRKEHYDLFYRCFIEWNTSKHEQFNHSYSLHPNKIHGYTGNLRHYCDFGEDDLKLYWHAFTRGPPIEKYRSIW